MVLQKKEGTFRNVLIKYFLLPYCLYKAVKQLIKHNSVFNKLFILQFYSQSIQEDNVNLLDPHLHFLFCVSIKIKISFWPKIVICFVTGKYP